MFITQNSGELLEHKLTNLSLSENKIQKIRKLLYENIFNSRSNIFVFLTETFLL